MEIGLECFGLMNFDATFSLKNVMLAEQAGFDKLWFGDHFLPWQHSNKQNFFTWSVLPVALSNTQSVPMGVDVAVPIGGRYHPAIIAQAAASIERMFPGRLSLGAGTGESMNESRFMDRWPDWKERMERFLEGMQLMDLLWNSEDYFDFHGKYFKMDKVFLYVKPTAPIPVYFSAMGPKSALLAGQYSTRLMTVGTVEKCRSVIFPKFEEGIRSVKKDPRSAERIVQIDGAVGNRREIIDRIRKYMAGAAIKEMNDEMDPRKIEEAATTVSDDAILSQNYICETSDELVEVFHDYEKIGTTHILWCDWNKNPEDNIDVFRRGVLPHFKGNN